ncbi:MAG: S41 family peptidase [Phycisphaerales bacterium]
MHTFLLPLVATALLPHGPQGYYRQPTIHDDTIVFVAEGDLWKVSTAGGVATRLTSHPGNEGSPQISPDGSLVAFTAQYEGPTEVYVMPLSGGLPKRLTYDAARCAVSGWKPGSGDAPARVIASTTRFSTLPNTQLTLLNPETGARELVPLAQAAEGVYTDDGSLVFARLAFQGSQTKRYKGGTAQNLWLFPAGGDEARPLTPNYTGTSATPMWWQGRVYFLSDRDGTMELFSMKPDGSGVAQVTNHDQPQQRLLDAKGASMHKGRIVYQLGADLWLCDANSGADTPLTITLDTDFDQTRENWVEKPLDYLSAASLSPDGSRVALTARGQVFVTPKESGRLVEVTRKDGVRYRAARFMPDGKSLVMLSDESGEVELWSAPADGSASPTQLTSDGVVLRWEAIPSPDGAKIAHHDKNQKLWVFDQTTKTSTLVETNPMDVFQSLAWSSDSRWLAYSSYATNFNRQIRLFDTTTGALTSLTTDRFDSTDVAFSADGKWLYVLSDRNIETSVNSPWGPLQPEPYFDNKTRLFLISLEKDARSPFRPADELFDPKADAKAKEEPAKPDPLKPDPEKPAPDSKPAEKTDTPPAEPDKPTEKPSDKPAEKPAPKPVLIDVDGIQGRLEQLPIAPGNFGSLAANEKRIFWLSSPAGAEGRNLMALDISNKDIEPKTIASGLTDYELSRDGKSILLRKRAGLFIIDASVGANADLSKAGVPLTNWTFPITPREEWRQMFIEAWRLERDYFYDTDMHGTDWPSILQRYLPLVDRVSTRTELSDLIAQMVAELSALHTFVRGGDERSGPDNIAPASLGAVLDADPAAGGFRVAHIYRADPDYPDRLSPLARPGVNVAVGDLIERVDHRPALSAPDLGLLLRQRAGKQVLLTVRPAAGGDSRQVVVSPISMGSEEDLRYHEWEYTRRLAVEAADATLGYVHLRAMGAENMNEFARGFYPVFNRKGLIIDVRHNRGGNIDSWVLSRLLRKAWFFWQPRVGDPFWNMQLAFRGHVVVLCNERTASDGEAFAEGIKRLNIGTVIGTRTWGGEIWLSSSNFLVDGGLASASEIGVYGPEGEWLIEGHGVDPDIVVDNLPHQTFRGKDAQLEAAIALLQKKIREQPVEVPPAPAHPDKSWGPNKRSR